MYSLSLASSWYRFYYAYHLFGKEHKMNIPSQGEPPRNRVSQSSWKGFHIKYTKDNQGLHLSAQDKPLRCQPLIGTLCHGKLTPLIEARKNNLLKHLRSAESAANPMNQLWISTNTNWLFAKAEVQLFPWLHWQERIDQFSQQSSIKLQTCPENKAVWKFSLKEYWLWMEKSSIECGNEACHVCLCQYWRGK